MGHLDRAFCEEKNNCCAEQNKYHEYDNTDLPQQFSIHIYQLGLQCCTGFVISRHLSNEMNTFFRDLMNEWFSRVLL